MWQSIIQAVKLSVGYWRCVQYTYICTYIHSYKIFLLCCERLMMNMALPVCVYDSCQCVSMTVASACL